MTTACIPATTQALRSESTTCTKCGQDMTFDVDADADMANPYMRIVDSWKQYLACDDCIAAFDAERSKNERLVNIAARVRLAVRDGDLFGDPRASCSFDRSDKAIEAVNYSVWETARNWNYDANLYVYGPVGVGKTYLARCLIAKALSDGYGAAELSSRRIVNVLRKFDGDAALLRWSRVKVLLIDDIDKIDLHVRDSLTALWELLDRRSKQHGRWTIVTSNMDSDGLYTSATRHEHGNGSLVTSLMERLLPVTKLEVQGKSLRRSA